MPLNIDVENDVALKTCLYYQQGQTLEKIKQDLGARANL
jgi:hypothetical protein